MTHSEFTNLDAFTRSYITAALWTFDEHPGIGEYTDSGRIELLVPRIAVAALDQMIEDCKQFQSRNGPLIESNLVKAGADFWLTRNHHGCGFWDGDWPEVGDTLTEEAQAFPEVSLYEGDDGLIYLGPA